MIFGDILVNLHLFLNMKTKYMKKTFSKKTIEQLIEKLKEEANNGILPKEGPRVVPRHNDT